MGVRYSMLANKVCSLIFFWFLATSVWSDESPESQEEGLCEGTEWGEWSACCKACTKSIEPFQERSREICNAAGEPMPLYDFQPCDPEDLLTEWSSWSECNAECDDIGSLSRTRVCGDDEFTETEEQECSGEPCSNCDPCNIDGSDSAMPCDEEAGLCNCILGYSGSTCESCQSGYRASGTLCIDCDCFLGGTEGDSTCDTSGQCNCVIPGYEGLTCSDCSSGYYDLGESTCVDCSCSTSGSSDSSCDGTGDCGPCNEGYSGLKCSECLPDYYFASFECLPCECYTSGTIGGSPSCLDTVGYCSCDIGYSGDKCDTCSSGYRSSGTLCIDCDCFPGGTQGDSTCDTSGQCNCAAEGYEGLTCTECSLGFFNPSGGQATVCAACPCRPGGFASCELDSDNAVTCTCNEGYTNRDCGICVDGYIDSNVGCRLCNCDTDASDSRCFSTCCDCSSFGGSGEFDGSGACFNYCQSQP